MNILALDYGQKNIGLAWCDTAIGAPLPFGVVKAKDERLKIKDLHELIEKEKIDLVIIGLPLGLDGKEKENTARAREFGEELKKQIIAPIEFFDERFSSAQADRSELGVSRDEKAAMIILQSYLDSRR